MVESQSVSTGARVPDRMPKTTPATHAVEPGPTERAIHDRVDISGEGQEMINLARGQELARDIRSKPVGADFAADLRKAMADISRITRLFAETVKAAFNLRT